MCRRCVEWPYVMVVDEDKPEESYTSEFRQPCVPGVYERGIYPHVEKTWINKEQS
jgi:hypothetical protein